MLEEPAMFKPLSYSSEFVSIRQSFVLSTDNASFKAKNIRAGSPDLFMSMVCLQKSSPQSYKKLLGSGCYVPLLHLISY